ncbi:DUF6456 domain-containing protein [Maricaulaceae bacterium MS644]
MSWIERLARPGRLLAPLPAGRAGYGVFAGGDRRRRPLALVSKAELRRALSDGALEPVAGGYALTGDGEDRARRDEAGAAGFTVQHGRVERRIVMEREGERSVFARSGGPLARYFRAQNGKPPLLQPVHAAAAQLLERDYTLSALQSRVTQDWSGMPRASSRAAPRDRAEAPVSRLDAQERVLAALDAVGPGFDRLLLNVVIRETGMRLAERELGWPERTGAPALKLALDRLAIHYRLKRRERVV